MKPGCKCRAKAFSAEAQSRTKIALRSGHLDADMAQIEDTDALFRWALEILPFRSKLDESQRAAFDAAFLARADAIGAVLELLIPFAAHRPPSQFNDGPGHPAA
jgi:hypothetical protein